ncbi:hypothetical protein ARMSODRAFT_976613 [Armillaria solidipes]|uniref:Uncharacterized protein n=1 Tax=Armillaria solidipes TaxID=1076256 RepID=A0A2H3BLL1_9AGAR|nr:hypothetical protein ARMSODRAFT_976613 [Armillaria solidipes]
MTRKSLADILRIFLALLCMFLAVLRRTLAHDTQNGRSAASPILISVPSTHCTAIHATCASDSQQSHELKRLQGALEAFVAAALDVQTPVAESSAGVLSLGFETAKMPALCCCFLHVFFPYLTGDIDETEGARMYTVKNTKEIDAGHGKRSIWGCRDIDWGWTASFASMPVGYSRVQTQMSSRNSTGNFACAQVGGRNEGTGGRTAILDGRNKINVHLYRQTTTNSVVINSKNAAAAMAISARVVWEGDITWVIAMGWLKTRLILTMHVHLERLFG